jgi:DNA ligase-1
MLAEDFDESKLKFPLGLQPKIDGVRGLNLSRTLTGRSLKTHKNKHVTALFSGTSTLGMDGELHLQDERSPTLCRNTTSAVNRIEGEPDMYWTVFDYITEETIKYRYEDRLAMLRKAVADLGNPRIRVIPNYIVDSLEQLLALEAEWLAQGYEGAIIRDMMGMHRDGRSTVSKGELLRIKRFIEEEAVVLEVVEGNSNNNEATTNELGRTERSSHQENMEPNGLVGALICIEKKTGMTITVSAGSMDHVEREKYFKQPELIVDKTIKFKHFPKGRKTLPRFPTFVTIRAESDMS